MRWTNANARHPIGHDPAGHLRYRSLPLVAATAITVAAVAPPRPAATSAGRPQPEGAATAPAPDLKPLPPLIPSAVPKAMEVQVQAMLSRTTPADAVTAAQKSVDALLRPYVEATVLQPIV